MPLRCHYNFVRPHRALRFGRATRTPAMQAGLATRRLTLRDIFVSVRRVVWWLSDVLAFADLRRTAAVMYMHAGRCLTTLDDGSTRCSVESVADDTSGLDVSVQRTRWIETARFLHFAGPCRQQNCGAQNPPQTVAGRRVRGWSPTLDCGSPYGAGIGGSSSVLRRSSLTQIASDRLRLTMPLAIQAARLSLGCASESSTQRV